MMRMQFAIAMMLVSACQVGTNTVQSSDILKISATYGPVSSETKGQLNYPQSGKYSFENASNDDGLVVNVALHPSCSSSEYFGKEMQAAQQQIEDWIQITRKVIADELHLKSAPDVFLLLVEVSNSLPINISTSCLASAGISIGFPMRQAGPNLQESQLLIFGLAHEYTEASLVMPQIMGCNLYGSSANNRWLGEGIANVVAARALEACGLPPIDWGAVASVGVDFASWNHGHSPKNGEVHAHYYQAMKKVEEWELRKKQAGEERPIWNLLDWLKTHKKGPLASDLNRWLH